MRHCVACVLADGRTVHDSKMWGVKVIGAGNVASNMNGAEWVPAIGANVFRNDDSAWLLLYGAQRYG